ncbi:MAG: glycosyltransferase family 4 protein [Syntrophales bacterium]|nr:glycosyltransferase family 4 protein [Syntrophales bacterium]
MKKKIYLLYPSFQNVGGAHNVIIDQYLGLKDDYKIIISSYDRYEKINDEYKKVIPESHYKRLSLLDLLFTRALIISHHRKLTTKLLLLSLFLKRNIIHIAHNEFFSLRYFTLYPSTIIAVSDRVKTNLIEYFRCKPSRVIVIKNGIHDRYSFDTKGFKYNENDIKILFPARITKVKNQLNIVNTLKNRLSKNVKIMFAGDGPLYSDLVKACKDDNNFIPLGFRSDMLNLYSETDYVMLFTEKEGLPISLLEAAMMGKPIICNNVGGNLEIVEDGVNGFVCNSFPELRDCINNLPTITEDTYRDLSKKVREKYLKEFTVNVMIEQYKKIISLVRTWTFPPKTRPY